MMTAFDSSPQLKGVSNQDTVNTANSLPLSPAEPHEQSGQSDLHMPSSTPRMAMTQRGSEDYFAAVRPAQALTEPHVVFYKLTGKLVDPEHLVPDKSKEIIYYTLSVGHNTGTFDCFTEEFTCSLTQFERILSLFEEGEPRRKLAGILTFSEIEIEVTDAPALSVAVSAAHRAATRDEDRRWLEGLSRLLGDIARESAVRLVGRRIA